MRRDGHITEILPFIGIRLVLRDAVAMIAVGIAIALPCVAALGKLVQSQLFGVPATDPATVAAAALVLAAGALAAAFIPACEPDRRPMPGIAPIAVNASNPV